MKIWIKILLLALTANFAFAFSAGKLVQDARAQVGRTLFYDPSYERLAYPMGDVDMIKAFAPTSWLELCAGRISICSGSSTRI